MSKNQFIPGDDSDAQGFVEGILDRSEGAPMGFTVSLLAHPVLNVDSVVTQILENALGDLDNLRRELEISNRKAVRDVRDHRFLQALAGVEETISYDGLLDIIKELKDGISLRRVQLMNEAFAAEGAKL